MAHRLTLVCLMSNDPLEKLAAMVVQHFSAIPDKRIPPTIFSRNVASIEQTEVSELSESSMRQSISSSG